jgi:FtsP/CotA-like multicopper oxidase with cupredoxin domain
MSPSERVLVEAQFTKSGTYHLKHSTPTSSYLLADIIVNPTKTEQDFTKEFQSLKDRSAEFADYKKYYAAAIAKEIDLTIDMPGMMSDMQMNNMMHGVVEDEGIEWEDTMALMNEKSTNKSLTWILQDKKTGAKNENINYVFKQGDKVKIRLFNDSKSMHPMQHTIHFHGNRFLVLSINGKKNNNLVWKDSVLVPVGATVDILLEATNPGTWMTHCHIAEHLESKMMFTYKVE